MFSDDNAQNLIMRIKLNINDSKIDDLLTELKALEYNILETAIIRGTKNIERVSLDKEQRHVYNPINKQFDKLDEWVAYTDGTNLREILGMANVDSVNTITNDVVEIYDVLGIEAARQALFNEINEVLDSVYVNTRHISLLVDVQTNKGNIMSIDRHGINRGDIGPLAKCSFEETTDKLIKAGIFAEFDKINGVSANIMLGQIAPCGTGDTDVLIDESKLSKAVTTFDINADGMLDDELHEEACTATNFAFDFTVPAVHAESIMRTKNTLLINK
jgi:DNA-directed RNA polymerase II subunit RPB1